MKNPWLAKNPFMSAWLSAANSVVGAATGSGRAAAARQSRAATDQLGKQVTDFWTAALGGAVHVPGARTATHKKATRKKRR